MNPKNLTRATSNRPKTPKSSKNNPFAQFELSKDQHNELKSRMLNDPNFVWDALQECIEARHKVSIRWDTYTDCPTAWVFAPEGDADNDGMIMSGRGRTAEKALAEALFKIYILAGNAWPKFEQRDGYVPWDE